MILPQQVDCFPLFLTIGSVLKKQSMKSPAQTDLRLGAPVTCVLWSVTYCKPVSGILTSQA